MSTPENYKECWNKDLKEKLKVGNRFELFPDNKENPNNCLIEIRAIVDKHRIVYAQWLENKKYWAYKIKDIFYFFLLNDNGDWELIKNNKDSEL